MLKIFHDSESPNEGACFRYVNTSLQSDPKKSLLSDPKRCGSDVAKAAK